MRFGSGFKLFAATVSADDSDSDDRESSFVSLVPQGLCRHWPCLG